MRITKDEVPAKIDVPGAKARQITDFGDASGYGAIAGEYFSLGAGTDIAPLLKGLDGDACSAPHWGFMISGEVVVTFTNGDEETCRGDDLFYWPPGHSVRVEKDAEVILFSPQAEHIAVMDHMKSQMGL
ncbi:MAG TPA: cupin domain-containing protein [Acidimicrobiia bacterium]|nr:cupin domain-containing protein [Acidimicrobiia bacterium]